MAVASASAAASAHRTALTADQKRRQRRRLAPGPRGGGGDGGRGASTPSRDPKGWLLCEALAVARRPGKFKGTATAGRQPGRGSGTTVRAQAARRLLVRGGGGAWVRSAGVQSSPVWSGRSALCFSGSARVCSVPACTGNRLSALAVASADDIRPEPTQKRAQWQCDSGRRDSQRTRRLRRPTNKSNMTMHTQPTRCSMHTLPALREQ